MNGLEKEYGQRIKFVKVNILNPESKALMDQYSFGATPELYLVNTQGRIIGSWDDSVGEEDLRGAFDKALSGQPAAP